jgi:hypothetical protein
MLYMNGRVEGSRAAQCYIGRGAEAGAWELHEVLFSHAVGRPVPSPTLY